MALSCLDRGIDGSKKIRGVKRHGAFDKYGITVEAIARSRDGRCVPAGICWVVERSHAWPSIYRRLNNIFERSREHLIALVSLSIQSILARRLKHLDAEVVSA